MCRVKQLAGFRSILFTHEDFEAQAAPGQVLAHAADSIGLDHGVDACGFEGAFGEVGFDLRGEAVDDHEFAVVHGVIIRLRTTTRIACVMSSRQIPQLSGSSLFFTLRCFVALSRTTRSDGW